MAACDSELEVNLDLGKHIFLHQIGILTQYISLCRGSSEMTRMVDYNERRSNN